MGVESRSFWGMVCDENTNEPIVGATVQMTGEYNHESQEVHTKSPDGGFLFSAEFFVKSSGDQMDCEPLWLHVSAGGYNSRGWGYGDACDRANGETWTLVPASGQGPQSSGFADLELQIPEPPTLKQRPLSGAPPTAWLGEWTDAQFFDEHPPLILTRITADTQHTGFWGPRYVVDIDDQIFKDTHHEENVGLANTKTVAVSVNGASTGGVGGASMAVVGINQQRPTYRVAGVRPGLDVLPAFDPGIEPTAMFENVRKFASKPGVLTDALNLENGILLELYGLYAPGNHLVDYLIRYKRKGGRGLGVDQMLERVIEIPT